MKSKLLNKNLFNVASDPLFSSNSLLNSTDWDFSSKIAETNKYCLLKNIFFQCSDFHLSAL